MNKHLVHITINAIRSFIGPLSMFIVSYVVVNFYNKDLWGEFVVELLFVNLIAHFLKWGNKDYLLRSFSKKPAKIQTLFYQNLFVRGLFLLPAFLIIVVFNLDLNKAFLIFLWVLGLFIYQSAESLIIYSKKFTIQVIAEVVGLIFIIVFFTINEVVSTTNLIQMFVVSTWIKSLIILFRFFS